MSMSSGFAVLLIAAAAGQPSVLRWEDVANALERHPALQVAASEVEAGSAAVAEARQFPNPSASAQLGRSEGTDEPVDDRVWGVEVSFPIPRPGERGGEIAEAEAAREAAASEAAALRLEVERDVAETFWHLVHDQARLAWLEESLGQLTELVDVARVRVEMGEARPLELDRIEIERARTVAERAEVIEEESAHRGLLRVWLGSDLPEAFRAEGELENLPPLPPLEEAVARAGDRHPLLAAEEGHARAALARLRAQRAARLPGIALGAFWERELDARTWGGAIELSLPLGNRNGGGIARARAGARTAALRQELRAAEIEAAVREAHARASAAYAKARSFREVILPKARSTTSALERMYQVGEIDVMDVLDARRSRIEIETELLQAFLDSRVAALRLFALTGAMDHD